MCGRCGCDWRLQMAQVVLYITTFATGLSVALSLGWSWVILDDHCVLGAKLEYKESEHNNSIELDLSTAEWGKTSICNYCTYTSVCTSIYAIIWFWCYILVSDWSRQKAPWDFRDRGHPPDVRILWPSMICHIPLCICAFASAILMSSGKEVWCSYVIYNFKHSCEYLGARSWQNVASGQLVFHYTSLAVSCGWLLVFSMTATILVIIWRLLRYNMEHNTVAIKNSIQKVTSSPKKPERQHSDGPKPRNKNVYIDVNMEPEEGDVYGNLTEGPRDTEV